jgi:hypothetical protein
MPYSSLGDFIKAADAIGEVQYVEGADLRSSERSGSCPCWDTIERNQGWKQRR